MRFTVHTGLPRRYTFKIISFWLIHLNPCSVAVKAEVLPGSGGLPDKDNPRFVVASLHRQAERISNEK
ncbi:MAG: hypothetical protein ACYDDT_09025 [Sulfuricella sp.]